MRYPVIKDTHSHDNFVIWCVSTAYTCIWTTEEHRFWGPGSVLMRLSTTQGRNICNTGEQHPHWALSSHCCLLNSKVNSHSHRDSAQAWRQLEFFLPSSATGQLPLFRVLQRYTLQQKEGLWRKGVSDLTLAEDCEMTAAPATTCSTAISTVPDLTKSEHLSFTDRAHCRSLPCTQTRVNN